MIFLTVRADGILDDALRGAVDAAVRLHGGGVRWRTSTRAARSYGLVELPDARGTTAAAAAAAAHGAGAYDSPVIALAVFPAEPEALQPILTALGGSGRPAGVRTCEPCPQGGAIVEWDLERSPAAVVLGVLDVELARFSSGRAAELLTPLPPAWIARIAADGLKAPDISQDRVLETLVERAGLRV